MYIKRFKLSIRCSNVAFASKAISAPDPRHTVAKHSRIETDPSTEFIVLLSWKILHTTKFVHEINTLSETPQRKSIPILVFFSTITRSVEINSKTTEMKMKITKTERTKRTWKIEVYRHWLTVLPSLPGYPPVASSNQLIADSNNIIVSDVWRPFIRFAVDITYSVVVGRLGSTKYSVCGRYIPTSRVLWNGEERR